MILCSAARTCNALGWVSIIWFTSGVISGSTAVNLQVKPQVEAKCGTNLTLTCKASSYPAQKFDVKLFSWGKETNVLCRHEKDHPDPGVLCEFSDHTLTLTLTLLDVMPRNKGKYLCKIHSNMGTAHASTLVTVPGCLERSGFSTNESRAECWFDGVHPGGVVHWFQGGVNLTDSARTWEEEEGRGRFKVMSDLNVDNGNTSQPYKCSLWIPTDGKYLSSHQITIAKKTKSSGSSVALQGICVVVWLVSFLDCIWKS